MPQMSRFQSSRRVQIESARYDDDNGRALETLDNDGTDGSGSMRLRPSDSTVTEDQEPFMGVKVWRKAYHLRDYLGDYSDVPSRPYLMRILEKQASSLEVYSFML